MPSTNKTLQIALSQFVGDDNLRRDDYNLDMLAIDNAFVVVNANILTNLNNINTNANAISNNANAISSNATAISGKLGATAKAADSNLLDGKDSSKYAQTDVAATFDKSVAVATNSSYPLSVKRTDSDTNISILLAGTTTTRYLGLGALGELKFGTSADIANTGSAIYHEGNFNPASYLGITGNAVSATKLKTARTITFSGDLNGSFTFDGSGNKTVSVGVNNASHTHTVANLSDATITAAELNRVDGVTSNIQTQLNGKLATSGVAADATKLGGLSNLYYRGQNYGATTADPNIATMPYLLSNHANSPDSGTYWHIRTQFYSNVSSSSNRSQIAIEYNPSGTFARAYVRSCYSNVWKAWKRIDNGGYTSGTADPSGGQDGDVYYQYE